MQGAEVEQEAENEEDITKVKRNIRRILFNILEENAVGQHMARLGLDDVEKLKEYRANAWSSDLVDQAISELTSEGKIEEV